MTPVLGRVCDQRNLQPDAGGNDCWLSNRLHSSGTLDQVRLYLLRMLADALRPLPLNGARVE